MATIDTSMTSGAGLQWLNDYLGGQGIDPATLQLAEKITARQLAGQINTLDGVDTRGEAIARSGSKGTVNLAPAREQVRAHAAKPHGAAYGQKSNEFFKVSGLNDEDVITVKRPDGTMAEVNAKQFFGKLEEGLHSPDPRRRARAQKQVRAFEQQGLSRSDKGDWTLPITRDSAAYSQFLGPQAAQEPMNQAMASISKRMGTIAKWSWVPVAGSVVGAYQSSKMMGDMAKLTQGAAGMTAEGAAGGAGAGALAAVGAGLSLGGSSAMTNLGFVGTDGMQFKMKSIMNSIAANYGDDQMIAMINSGNMPIEDLIAYFMAYMSEKFEQKLREKMEETALQEKRERSRQLRKDSIGAIGGLVSMIPGVGTAVGAGLQLAGTAMDKMDVAMNGESKSSTILMQEIQILTQKWKQVVELYSELSKMLHDMAMSVIRKIG